MLKETVLAVFIVVSSWYWWSDFSSQKDQPPNSVLELMVTSYNAYVYFNFTSFSEEFFISESEIKYGKWWEKIRDVEIPNDQIPGRKFDRYHTMQLGACGREWSPAGTEGSFSLSVFDKILNHTELVLEVYFNDPYWFKEDKPKLFCILKTEHYVCHCTYFDCKAVEIGNITITCI